MKGEFNEIDSFFLLDRSSNYHSLLADIRDRSVTKANLVTSPVGQSVLVTGNLEVHVVVERAAFNSGFRCQID